MFIAASGITDNARKHALILYEAGSRIHDIFAHLPDTGEANDFDTAMDKRKCTFNCRRMSGMVKKL